MKRAGIFTFSLLLAASAASADQFKDDCKNLRKGSDRIGGVALYAFQSNGLNFRYLQTVEAFGKSDLQLFEGFKAVLAEAERADPHSGEAVVCDKVQEALAVLDREYRKVLEKFGAAKAPCSTGDVEGVKKGECGKAVKAAFDLRDAFWKGPVRAYARAESQSNQQCQARYNGYGGFYELQNEPTSRRVSGNKKLAEKLYLKEQAEEIRKAWREGLAKVKGGILKPAVGGSWSIVNNAETGYRAFLSNAATPNKRLFEASINAAVAANMLKTLHTTVCTYTPVDTNGNPTGPGAGGGPGDGAGGDPGNSPDSN